MQVLQCSYTRTRIDSNGVEHKFVCKVTSEHDGWIWTLRDGTRVFRCSRHGSNVMGVDGRIK